MGGWAAVFVLMAAIAIYKYNTARPTFPWKDLPHPTWKGVPAALEAGVKSEQYKEGGKHLSNPSMLKTASDEQKTAYFYRVVIDFLRSLTPEQINIISKKPIFFKQLNPEQQKALISLVINLSKEGPGSPSAANIEQSAKKSAGIFVSDFSDVEKNALLFNYLIPGTKGGYGGICLSFSATGKAKRQF